MNQETESRMYWLKNSSYIYDTSTIHGGRIPVLQDDSRDAYMEVGGRATHDYMDVEGRIASGTAIEDAKAEREHSIR